MVWVVLRATTNRALCEFSLFAVKRNTRECHSAFFCSAAPKTLLEVPPADPGCSGDAAPLPPRFISKSVLFSGFFRENPYFEQMLGSGPLGSQLAWALLTKILDPPLDTPFQGPTGSPEM